MEYVRRPRFKRTSAVAPIELTERDREIMRLVYRHRFLRSSHIVSLLEASSQPILRRLQLLYHHGYLERPHAQIDFYQKGGSRPMVYGIGNKAITVLQQASGFSPQRYWSEKNRSVHRMFLEHALLVSDVMVAIELACRQSGIRLLTERELGFVDSRTGERQLFRWKVKVSSRLNLGIIPDRVFALEYTDPTGKLDRAFYFLEADRGTMPVMRKSLSQTSCYRKLLAYEATWSQSIHRTRFGFHRFRVLTVTNSSERVKSLIEACSKLKRGHGLFLFADRAMLEKPGDIFSPIWQTANQSEPITFFP